jgi:hypothetical protein
VTVLPESPQSRVSESLAEMEPCPRCQLSDRVRRKLVLINPWDEAHAAAHPHWRVTCACQGDLTVDSLRPEFISQGPSAQFIQALYCERCCVGFVPDYMAKPAPPRYQGGREGFRRVFPDGTVGPLLTRIADDPDTGNVDFYLDSQVVGFFKNGTRPASDGIYAYEPYRSPGHLTLIRQNFCVRCVRTIEKGLSLWLKEGTTQTFFHKRKATDSETKKYRFAIAR